MMKPIEDETHWPRHMWHFIYSTRSSADADKPARRI